MASFAQKKLKVNFPKLLIPLKDSIIVQVACGHTHSAAVTFNGNLLTWGSNQQCQLGIGNEPKQVPIPVQVPNLSNVQEVSCGSEHTAALTTQGLVYTWGEGEGGLLGHGDQES